ncbi:hypothetical protein [Polyangium sorediatum]|uniref:Lipoprotein n=1 Tax=Polyangium sorediatum TaxID=889274 RepID=A0ABT6NUW0_9BACT|nr:hypothetical protein [Polyangium sorediatum]MDI1432112.1 hypothetical protein [Polyangium sorediatum]
MSPIRLASLVLVSLSAGLLLGCPGTETPPGGSAGTGGTGGTGGMGGLGGMGGDGGMTTSSSGTGGALPMCTDFGDVTQSDCNLLAQDCEGANETCRPNSLGTGTVCEGGGGVKGVGAKCTASFGECAAGLYCVFGYCTPVCCQSEPAFFCGSAKCSVRINYGSKRIWTCNFAPSCTLFDGKECDEDTECRLTVLEDELALCVPPSGKFAAEGEPCDAINDCGEAQRCDSVCRYSCLNMGWQDLELGKGGCPAGQTCTPDTPLYGVCRP